jgi:hypothetical protein
MPYINADTLFPPDLLKEIQKYVQGALVYIPRLPEQRLGWGRKNGSRDALDRRDASIRTLRAAGYDIEKLAEEFGLSPDGIRKVLYKKSAGGQTRP